MYNINLNFYKLFLPHVLVEFSIDRCAHAGTPADADLTAFNSTCYEFVVTKGGSFQDAKSYCKSRGGDLVHGFKVKLK